jgi:hypothetical protein
MLLTEAVPLLVATLLLAPPRQAIKQDGELIIN